RRLLLDRLGLMRVAVAEDIDRDARGEIEVALALFPEQIDSLAAHWAHRRTRVNGHERRDGQDGLPCSGDDEVARAYSQRPPKRKGAPDYISGTPFLTLLRQLNHRRGRRDRAAVPSDRRGRRGRGRGRH